jgi:hypothetical protein
MTEVPLCLVVLAGVVAVGPGSADRLQAGTAGNPDGPPRRRGAGPGRGHAPRHRRAPASGTGAAGRWAPSMSRRCARASRRRRWNSASAPWRWRWHSRFPRLAARWGEQRRPHASSIRHWQSACFSRSVEPGRAAGAWRRPGWWSISSGSRPCRVAPAQGPAAPERCEARQGPRHHQVIVTPRRGPERVDRHRLAVAAEFPAAAAAVGRALAGAGLPQQVVGRREEADFPGRWHHDHVARHRLGQARRRSLGRV